MSEVRGRHRNALARRLALTKSVFIGGCLLIVVVLVGAGPVVDALPGATPSPERQIATPAPPVSPELVAALAAIAPAGRSEPPLLLTYHEISPTEDALYTLTPTVFAEQMRMLAEAGYRTIRPAELLEWMDGRAALPPKSVFISFDDGTAGVWRYADPILAQYGFTATAFIITSYPGRGPRYMTWDQIDELARSGRWDIGSHTRAGHRYITTTGEGAEEAFLTGRAWLADAQRRETHAEYQERITVDLEGSIADLQARGLPAPRLFSFPFSAAGSAPGPATGSAAAPADREATEILTALTNRLFGASLLDDSKGGVTTPEQLGRRQLRRLNIVRSLSASAFAAEIALSSVLPVRGPHAFAGRDAWRAVSNSPAFTVDNGAVRLRIPARGWSHVGYQPTRTVFWRDYSVALTAAGLNDPGTSAGVSLWTGSPNQVTVSVSSGWIYVKAGTQGRIIVHDGRLPRFGARHALVVSVDRGRLSVMVDGFVVLRHRAVPAGLGGVGVFGSAGNRAASVRFADGRIGPPRRLR
jgi:poly-beta-1,6-N-acetyl-D-glucosamine N-deacetylase